MKKLSSKLKNIVTLSVLVLCTFAFAIGGLFGALRQNDNGTFNSKNNAETVFAENNEETLSQDTMLDGFFVENENSNDEKSEQNIELSQDKCNSSEKSEEIYADDNSDEQSANAYSTMIATIEYYAPTSESYINSSSSSNYSCVKTDTKECTIGVASSDDSEQIAGPYAAVTNDNVYVITVSVPGAAYTGYSYAWSQSPGSSSTVTSLNVAGGTTYKIYAYYTAIDVKLSATVKYYYLPNTYSYSYWNEGQYYSLQTSETKDIMKSSGMSHIFML